METGASKFDDYRYRGAKGDGLLFLRTVRKTFDFRGRSQRTEYWIYAILGQFVAFGGLLPFWLFDIGLNEFQSQMIVVTLFQIPFTALLVRRIHDIGASGWWSLPIFAFAALAYWATAVFGGNPGSLFNALDELKPALGPWLIVPQIAVPLAVMAIGFIPPTKDREAYGGDPRF